MQPAQPFAGEQHHIIERQAHQPFLHRRGIRNIPDRDERAAQGFSTLLLKHPREPVELAGFGEGNAAAGKRADNGVAAHRKGS